MESATIIYGTSDSDRYTITENELNTLVNLPNNVNVSGFVYYPEPNYQYKDELNFKFPNLSITDTLPAEGAVLSFNGALEEGKSLRVNSNVQVAENGWSYTIDGEISDLGGLITTSNAGGYSITFNAK